MSSLPGNETPSRSVDTPARIAIIGAGPIGIETGLYARYLGYDIVVLERGEVADNVQKWGHISLSSPFSLNCSPLGLAALNAQDPDSQMPSVDAHLTGTEWARQYIIPLARTDLLNDHIRTNTAVVEIRENLNLVADEVDEPRENSRFEIAICGQNGEIAQESADVIIDSSGVYGNSDPSQANMVLADLEPQLAARIEHGIPDVVGSKRSQFAAKRTLVVGDTVWATMTLIELSKLIDQAPDTHVTWIPSAAVDGPSDTVSAWTKSDTQAERQHLSTEANHLICGSTPNIKYRPDFAIRSVDYDPAAEQFVISTKSEPSVQRFDQIVMNSGYCRDTSFFGSLIPDLCPPTPAQEFSDNTASPPTKGNSRSVPTPHFYALGAKSYGSDSRFLFSQGLRQIVQLFSIIGGRSDLDLYATAMAD